MFQIPEWEETIPAPNLDFLKEIKKKQHKQNNKKLIPTTKNHSEFNNNNEKLVEKSTEIIHTKRKKTLKKRDVVSNSVTKKKTPVIINNFSGIKKTHKSKHINNNFKTKEEFVNKEDDSRVDSKVVQQCNKRKHESCFKNKDDLNENKDDLNKNKVDLNENKDDLNENFEVENFDTDMLDEVIINAKKQKLKKFKHKEEKDVEEMFSRTISKDDRKKQLLKNILQKEGHRNTYKVNGNGLRERMLQRLKAAQFRYLNEKLYTSSGSDAKKLFDEDPNAFHTYHQGYQQQVKKWPVKPLDVIVKRILKMPKSHLITDMGCGEGSLSRRVPQTVRSFDLVAFNDHVEVCDIAHTPLLASSMNAAVYCLALMGTDLTQYIVEANRVLKKGGHLLIAEVESRFDDVDKFITDVQRIGFTLKELDKSNDVFYFMEFTKVNEPPKKNKLPFLSLKPCFYKKR